MGKIHSKLFGIRFYRRLNAHRYKIIFIAIIILCFAYQIVPKLIFKVPWTYSGWQDSDFRLVIDRNEIIILRWTSLWNENRKPEVLTSEKCPYLKPTEKSGKIFDVPCRLSYDRRYLSVSDALLFHSWDLTREEVPKRRQNDQIWVYLQQECPKYTKLDLKEYSGVFNWTMTYRRDSDVYHPYGHIVPLNPTSDDGFKNNESNLAIVNPDLAKRHNLIAWIVSSCDSTSKRENFVHELQKHIPVSIYGWCGEACPSYTKDCYAHVTKTHKFYLSLENSICLDYITEKFFNALKSNMVPVVYGGLSSQDYSDIAPEGSYIDARKYNSPKELADYLIYLDKNDKEYLKYFEWKNKQKVIESLGYCNLCQKVYEQLTPEVDDTNWKAKQKWYKDLWTWWNYISYDTSIEEDEVSTSSKLMEISKSYNYKLGGPTCFQPISNLTMFGGKHANVSYEPKVLSLNTIYKFFKWVKEIVFG